MKEKTYLTNSLEIYGDMAKYDRQAKTIISSKIVLSKILKATVREVSCFTEEEIAEFIADVGVSEKNDGLSEKESAIESLGTEDINPKQGNIIYDIRFNLVIPKEQLNKKIKIRLHHNLKLLFNIEIQKDYNPGYDIVTRGEYYCARMISAERGTEFRKNDFNNLKKVYSIWICVESSANDANSIAIYETRPKVQKGENIKSLKRISRHRYDLMNLCIIGLNDDSYTKNGIYGFLGTIFTEKLSREEKIQILEERFGIKSAYEIAEVKDMCNVSELIYEKGIEKGIEKGRLEQLVELAKEGIVNLSEASKRAHMSEKEFALLLK